VEKLGKYGFCPVILIFVFVLMISGCATVHGVAAQNRSNLLHLSVGMPREEVLKVMGTETIYVLDVAYQNPHRTEMYRTDTHTFELLLYRTEVGNAFHPSDRDYTPLVLMDGKLDGWGWMYWHDVAKKYEIKIVYENK
jgi:hypothetical protein